MKLAFTKMHGAGNDFVVIDATREPFSLSRAQLQRIADRHLGVGCDQILVVEPGGPDVDFRYRIFNADGGEVEQCGNGARCFVKFVHRKGLTAKREIRVETLGGRIAPRLEPDGEVSVDMGAPSRPVFETLEVDGEALQLALLSMGNPHAVQLVEDIATAPVTTQGPKLERHPRFPSRVNAGYMQVLDRRRIALRVWERGAGLTRACGTAACAAAVAGHRLRLLGRIVTVSLPGGDLFIEWRAADDHILMTGPFAYEFEGEIPEDLLKVPV
jgi:diaminopimelate epimerase